MTWLMFILIVSTDNSQAVAEFNTKLGCDTAAVAVGTQYQVALAGRGRVMVLCVPNEKLTM